ncbi:MAG TPA: hypothetical protein VMT93_08170, partial [Gemmatimonadaceae bacterium]|nr:hypothetical protein [Gemmatimonadaceae bacterium]
MRPSILRWKAVAPLAAVLLLLCGGWALFGDWLVRRALESAGSALLGTEVDIASLRITTLKARVAIGGLEIASPFDSTKDTFAAGAIVMDLAPGPLLEKKLVIDQLSATGLRFGVTRARPARPRKASSAGAGAKLLAEASAWTGSVKAPLLALTPIDTVKSLVLNPGDLATMKAVDALHRRADSVRAAVTQQVAALQLQALADSTQALVKRLQGVKPSLANLAGTAQAVQDAKRGIDRIDAARKQVAALE